MRVDFYQLSRDPAETVVPLLAQNTLKAGVRMLVVSGDEALTGRISAKLWERRDSFLAHGMAGGSDDARQPILLASQPDPANGARYIALADGQWRDEALTFERAFLLFGEATIEAARGVWRSLDGRDDAARNYWRQDGGKWIKAA